MNDLFTQRCFFYLVACSQKAATKALNAAIALGMLWSASVFQYALAQDIYSIETTDLRLEFNQQMHSRVVIPQANGDTILTAFSKSEYVSLLDGSSVTDFVLLETASKDFEDDVGQGRRTTLKGKASNGLVKLLDIKSYRQFPSMLVMKVTYTNESDEALKILKWINNHHLLNAQSVNDTEQDPYFWSFQGASHSDRRDWVMKVAEGYFQQNYMGMNASDYGSGTPIADIWHEEFGIAVGHVELDPELVSLPVSYKEDAAGASLHIELEKSYLLKPTKSMSTLSTFINVHKGDYYASLKAYRELMSKKGLPQAPVPDSAYETIWCAWGYDRDFTVDEVLNTLPKAKELGLKWAVIDDGWQTSEGDWYLHPAKFPNGDSDMQALVDNIEAAGLKPKLWWAPLAVDPGTDLHKNHVDMLLLNKDGSTQDITWWDSYYLCPAYAATLDYTEELVKTMMKTWGFDGLKIDGQHLNGVPPCYNPAHKHEHPEDSVKGLNEFWKRVYDTAIDINTEAVVEICPCGTSYAFHNLPYMNQTVSSDPLNSWQLRHKGKTLKGLMGESAPYYGDHVELSDNANDFASSVGIGAVVGTKFTIDSGSEASKQFTLDENREATWKKWISIYEDKMLPKGEYLGELYDIGFDKPETHAIRKGARLYYAFYADEFAGYVQYRGLQANVRYSVYDYVNDKDLGLVSGPIAQQTIRFSQYLLLELIPIED